MGHEATRLRPVVFQLQASLVEFYDAGSPPASTDISLCSRRRKEGRTFEPCLTNFGGDEQKQRFLDMLLMRRVSLL